MTVKSISTSLLALACAATALAQTATSPGVRRLPARPIRQASTTAQTNDTPSGVRQLPARSSSLSRSSSASAPSVTTPYIAPTAKSDDLVESPATNVIKGAFGYTLGAIWDGSIPEDAKAVVENNMALGIRRDPVFEPQFGRIGEVTFPVKANPPLPPFETVTLSVSTNDHRIAAIAAETSHMALAESYTETLDRLRENIRSIAESFELEQYPIKTNAPSHNRSVSDFWQDILLGKLFRNYINEHPDDPDAHFKDYHPIDICSYRIVLNAGSRYNERRAIGDMQFGKPDYLQTIEQPLNITAIYYPYAVDAVIRFSVRDVEDRTEHTNLVSVADLKKRAEEEATEKGEEKAATPSSYIETLRRRQANRAAQATQNAEEIAKLREEIAKAAQTSKEEAAKRERAINLELISRGQEPLSPIELTSKEDTELVRKGALPPAENVSTQQTVKFTSEEDAKTNHIQNICGIPLGGKLKEVTGKWKGSVFSSVKTFTFGSVTNAVFSFGPVIVENTRRFSGGATRKRISILNSSYEFSGNCSIYDDTIFSLYFRAGRDDAWPKVSDEDKETSGSQTRFNRLAETLSAKYGEPQYASIKTNTWYYNESIQESLQENAWQMEDLVIILSLNSSFSKQTDGLFKDNSYITLQYIREDLLPKAKAESDAYEAAKKAEAEHKAKADAEAWPEEMKKAMESL